MRHPDEEQLLRYLDGELSAGAARAVRSHLEACWECRVEAETIERTISNCVQYRKQVLATALPSPPAPWVHIRRRFEEADASVNRPGIFARLGFVFSSAFAPRIWAAGALAALVATIGIYWLRDTPSVQAAELLRKAQSAASLRPVATRRIRLRTGRAQITRLVGAKTAVLEADTAGFAAIEADFRAAGYNWSDPLSVDAYQSWRDRLAQKQDNVVKRVDAYTIETTTESNELTRCSLRLNAADLRPLQADFEFRDRQWVEITEVAAPVSSLPEPVAAAPRSPSEAVGNRSAPVPPAPAATVNDELNVLAALHRIGADLGDPIEVSLEGANVLVSGVGIAPQRQQQIRAALASQSRLQFRFSEDANPKSVPERASATVTPENDVLELQSRLAGQVGGRAQFEHVAAEVLDLSDTIMSHAYALRRLAEQFPPNTESGLDPEGREILARLASDHTTALRQETSEIRRVLRPLFAGSGPPATPQPANLPMLWQPATEEVFQNVRRVDKLLAVLFGASPGGSPGQDLPSQLDSSLESLRSRLDAYRSLSATLGRKRE